MRRDARPYWLYRRWRALNRWYVRHYIAPQFDSFPQRFQVMGARFMDIWGKNIHLGESPTLIGAPDARIRISTYELAEHSGRIQIGDYCLITPGVRIASASEVVIGDNCMFARDSSISDADWHGLYDRSHPVGATAPIRLGNNVWLGEAVIVCKDVSIGDNTVVGAGSVVTRDLPANVIAAGSPAEPLRELDMQQDMKTRADTLGNPDVLRWLGEQEQVSRQGNSLAGWLRSLLKPTRKD